MYSNLLPQSAITLDDKKNQYSFIIHTNYSCCNEDEHSISFSSYNNGELGRISRVGVNVYRMLSACAEHLQTRKI